MPNAYFRFFIVSNSAPTGTLFYLTELVRHVSETKRHNFGTD